MNNKIDNNNLKYVVLSSGDEYSFDELDDPLVFLNNIKKGKISLKEARDDQQNYYNYLNTTRRGNKNANQKTFYQILTFILMREIKQSNLLKIMVQ